MEERTYNEQLSDGVTQTPSSSSVERGSDFYRCSYEEEARTSQVVPPVSGSGSFKIPPQQAPRPCALKAEIPSSGLQEGIQGSRCYFPKLATKVF